MDVGSRYCFDPIRIFAGQLRRRCGELGLFRGYLWLDDPEGYISDDNDGLS